jgi:2-C-methyl-D-erythritol 4-phosphate cytidylyltransferase / 2-C-methyl-D-erythritol 2,4-cyclodiphosphate synthase
MRVTAIIAAAGQGTRIGSAQPKQFLDLGDGTIMLNRSVDALLACELIEEIVVAIPPEMLVAAGERSFPKRITQVAGGARRQDSVANALAAVSPDADVIVIHDAARPFVSVALLERTIRTAYEHGAAIAAMPVYDTVKQATSSRTIAATLPRDAIFLAQTPQAFRRDVLVTAMAAAADTPVTDESMLVERAGFDVHLVDGEAGNIKVTTPQDLANVRAGLATAATVRIGSGYDLHRLEENRPLVLAGVTIPFERGLVGHSDADIVCHAITDAVLGAAALGDIGRLFPDTEAEWKDADSLKLLQGAMNVVREAGYAVVNVDATIIAERPKLLPYVEAMRANLAAVLAIDPSAVSIKGKTNERVGEIGRGEAMACHAVALLSRLPRDGVARDQFPVQR